MILEAVYFLFRLEAASLPDQKYPVELEILSPVSKQTGRLGRRFLASGQAVDCTQDSAMADQEIGRAHV